VNARSNWWGCRMGPNFGGTCSAATGTVDFTSWLKVP
jgi:hypothetical protein